MADAESMSASLPKADMCGAPAHVCFVPIADISYAQKKVRLVAFLVSWNLGRSVRVNSYDL